MGTSGERTGQSGRGRATPRGARVTALQQVSFDRFFREQHAPLFRLAYAMTGSRNDAEDLAQEALARACEHWASVQSLDRPEAWVRRVLVNLVYGRSRRRAVERNWLARQPREHAGSNDTELSESSERFWAAVRSLAPQQAKVAALRWAMDLTTPEIAEILEIDVGTVRSTMFDARRRLAKELDVEARRRPAADDITGERKHMTAPEVRDEQ